MSADKRIQAENLFSDNEELDDISAVRSQATKFLNWLVLLLQIHLKFVLCPYYLAKLLLAMEAKDMAEREPRVKRAVVPVVFALRTACADFCCCCTCFVLCFRTI